MGALLDRNQKVQFHFGNAMVDLAHLLPSEEETPAQRELREIYQILALSENTLGALKSSKEKLSFLLADLRRMIR